jgi:RNA-directed DNA polymerase
LKARIVRYADDFVVLCAGAVDAPLDAVRHVLDRLDLTLNETKTRIVDARKESFNFFGFEIRVSKSWNSGKSYPHVCPAPKSLVKWGKQGCRRQAATRKIKDRITQLTARERTPIPLEDIVGSVNVSLLGGANYFHYRNSSVVSGKIRTHAEERLRTHLMERHKVRNRGFGISRFPRQLLYAKYGLYKVPTTAGWT